MKTKQILATFALLATVITAATFISCSKDDNPVDHKPFNEDEATLVTNDAELRDAIAKGTPVKLANDIQLSNKTLEIAGGKTVTIDLGGHTLDRGLKACEYNTGGQVITVRKGATLNLSNGSLTGGYGRNGGGLVNEGGTANLTNVNITGNTANDRGGGISNQGTLTMTGGSISDNTTNDQTAPEGGGGIMNSEGATATLTNVSITGNTVKVKGGGGICNFGALTIDGCTITGNTAGSQGGGIWQEGTLNIKGTIVLNNNLRSDGVTDNLYLRADHVVTVTGALTGSSIGVNMEKPGAFTSGYSTDNDGVNPATIFSADLTGIISVSLDDNKETQLTNALPDGDIYYIERSWDDASMTLKAEIKTLKSGSYTVLSDGDDITLQPGYYVVKDNIEVDDIILEGSGEHHFILCDGAQIEADFLDVEEGQTAIIYGQANNSGRLYIPYGYDDEMENEAAIGGRKGKPCGTVIFHGGDIYAVGRYGGAGIGGGNGGDGGNVIIYGGNIYASSGTNDDVSGAGIGGGYFASGGTITIYGGHVKVEGRSKSSGMGSGRNIGNDGGSGTGPLASKSPVTGGTITIYGGYIEVQGGYQAAGIGGGSDGGGANVTIHGGRVIARGGGSGPGIGAGETFTDALQFRGKLIVNGGEVYAYGDEDGAGIGGGKDTNGCEVIINGGYVYAKGGAYAAGIGSGNEGITKGGVNGGSLTVTGGRVEAYGGEDGAGIGGGEDADCGTINISGGYVYAKGSYGGAGIGGGEEGDGGNVTITGGTVHASAGEGGTGNRAIGPGKGEDDAYGSLTIGDLMMVYSERMAAEIERHDMCWYRTDVHVELCTHPGYTADTCPYHKH